MTLLESLEKAKPGQKIQNINMLASEFIKIKPLTNEFLAEFTLEMKNVDPECILDNEWQVFG